jgi:type II secretory ATPase GspE/PulE/Tfp pilus assembly ATPase PilB-like protein/CheY-like chemotaxis protein
MAGTPLTNADAADEWLIDSARRAGHAVRGERGRGTTAWRMLLNAGIAESEVLRLACAASGNEAADFQRISPALGALLPHGTALQHRVVPLGIQNKALDIATSNPKSAALERELAFAAKQRIRLRPASPADILAAQAVVYGAAYGTPTDFKAFQAPAAMPPTPAPVARLTTAIDARTLVSGAAPGTAPGTSAASPDITDRLLAAAFADRASEVILEPGGDGGFVVRLRVDGSLNDRFRIAAPHVPRVVQTLKKRAAIAADKVTGPVRGRMLFATPNGLGAVRVCVEPARIGGERVVLRLFASQGLLGVAELGYPAPETHRLRQILASASGIMVIAGPPGAGTTTTLYAAVLHARRAGRLVATVEEPIDYPLDQIAQVQVSESPFSTITSAVRAALASPVSVVGIGTPADAAMLELCVAPDGRQRLVIICLGTSDMPATVAALHLLLPNAPALATALQGVIAQRLVRKLCVACAVPQPVHELPEQQQRLLFGLPTAKLRKPIGCQQCRSTGYSGRTAIAEVVPMLPGIRAAVARGATQAELALAAMDNGIGTLWNAGMTRVLEGVISLADLLDSVPPPAETGAEAPQEDIDALLAQLLGSPKMQPGVATPATPAARTASGDATAVVSPPAVSVPRVSAPTSGAVRILLADDDAPARRALAQELTQAGFQVVQVADGEAAVAYAKRLRPDIVLTDVALPRLDAIGVLAALASGATPITVAVHTMQDDEGLNTWLKEAGARAVLRRDMPFTDLVRELHALAPLRRPQ